MDTRMRDVVAAVPSNIRCFMQRDCSNPDVLLAFETTSVPIMGSQGRLLSCVWRYVRDIILASMYFLDLKRFW